MDHYTAERLILERHRRMVSEAERNARLLPHAAATPLRVWVAGGLRTVADRLDDRPRLRRVV